MDLSQINDPTILKAMVYDNLVTKEQAEENIRRINQRISQLAEIPPPLSPKDKAERSGKKNAKTAKTAEDSTLPNPE